MKGIHSRWLPIHWMGALALLLSACASPWIEREYADSVVLVYMAGGNNLDAAGVADIEEMLGAELGSEWNRVLVLFDRMAEASDGPDDWDETRLFEIRAVGGKNECVELPSVGLGLSTDYVDDELDMGDGYTLMRFLCYAQARYDAWRWHLVLWNHGSGWPEGKGIALDDESGSMLSMAEIRKAVGFFPRRFGIVLLDACLMASIEVAAAFEGKADYLVASQLTVPFDGMPYGVVLPALLGTGGFEEGSCAIVDAYHGAYAGQSGITASALRIDAAGGLRAFADFLSAWLEGFDPADVRRRRMEAEVITDASVDIGVFDDGSEAWDDGLARFVAYCPDAGYSGASIFFPEYLRYDPLRPQYIESEQHFLDLLPYREWLESYLHTGIPWDDDHEPDGSREEAMPLSAALAAKIWCPQDRDWYSIQAPPEGGFTVELQPPEGHDYDLRLFWTSGGKVRERESIREGSLLDSVTFDCADVASVDSGPLYVLVFPSSGDFCQTAEYSIHIE